MTATATANMPASAADPQPHTLADSDTPPAAGAGSLPALCRWVHDLATSCGEPLSVTMSAVTRTVHVHVVEEEFRLWSTALPAGELSSRSDELGTLRQATGRYCGWSVTVTASESR